MPPPARQPAHPRARAPAHPPSRPLSRTLARPPAPYEPPDIPTRWVHGGGGHKPRATPPPNWMQRLYRCHSVDATRLGCLCLAGHPVDYRSVQAARQAPTWWSTGRPCVCSEGSRRWVDGWRPRGTRPACVTGTYVVDSRPMRGILGAWFKTHCAGSHVLSRGAWQPAMRLHRGRSPITAAEAAAATDSCKYNARASVTRHVVDGRESRAGTTAVSLTDRITESEPRKRPLCHAGREATLTA